MSFWLHPQCLQRTSLASNSAIGLAGTEGYYTERTDEFASTETTDELASAKVSNH